MQTTVDGIKNTGILILLKKITNRKLKILPIIKYWEQYRWKGKLNLHLSLQGTNVHAHVCMWVVCSFMHRIFISRIYKKPETFMVTS